MCREVAGSATHAPAPHPPRACAGVRGRERLAQARSLRLNDRSLAFDPRRGDHLSCPSGDVNAAAPAGHAAGVAVRARTSSARSRRGC